MSVTVKCESPRGGAVAFEPGVWASYAVATAGDLPPPPCLTASVALADGRTVQVFVNRDTGLTTVDVVDKRGTGGVEVFRRIV